MKNRILYVMEILYDTCEASPITMREILMRLTHQGISAERKSIYQDIEALVAFGMDITTGGRGKYFLATRDFELPEIRLLTDAVRAAQFISEKKTIILTDKLLNLCAPYERKAFPPNTPWSIQKQIKTDNELIYYTIDLINNSIANSNNLSFNYYEYLPSKEKQLKKQGKDYVVQPLSLVWSEQKYYLIAYEFTEKCIKHFRVDKIGTAYMQTREPGQVPIAFDSAGYLKKNFSMFSGREASVRMQFDNSLIGVVIDRFGEDMLVSSNLDGTFSIGVTVNVSPQFYGWIFGLWGKAKILSPAWVKEEYEEMKKQ